MQGGDTERDWRIKSLESMRVSSKAAASHYKMGYKDPVIFHTPKAIVVSTVPTDRSGLFDCELLWDPSFNINHAREDAIEA